VEHLQTTTTRKREMACRLLHIGSQKIRISSLPVVCLEGNTNTQLVFLFLFIPRWLCRRRRRHRVFGGEWVPNLELYGAETDMDARVYLPPPPLCYSLFLFFRLYIETQQERIILFDTNTQRDFFEICAGFFFSRCASTSINIGASTWHPRSMDFSFSTPFFCISTDNVIKSCYLFNRQETGYNCINHRISYLHNYDYK
jgi:hypothetical protein